MTTLVNSLEGGTSGTTLTGGSGGNTTGGGNFLDTISIVAGGTLTFDNTHAAHGLLSCSPTCGATSGQAFAAWDASLGSGITQVWFRQYLYFTANPGAAYKVFAAFSAAAGSINAGVQLNTNGTLTFQDDAGASITGMTTTETIPLNRWFRIEGFIIGSATVGQVELKIFFGGPDDFIPTNTYTSAATVNTRGTMGSWRYGVNTNRTNTVAFWQDDLGISTDGYIGPAAGTYPVSNAQFPPVFYIQRATAIGMLKRRKPTFPAVIVPSVTSSQQFTETLTAPVAVSASTQNLIGRTVNATIAVSGNVIRQLSHALQVLTVIYGTTQNQISRIFTGEITVTDAVTAVRTRVATLIVPIAVTVSQQRTVNRVLSAMIAVNGVLTRNINHTAVAFVALPAQISRVTGKAFQVPVIVTAFTATQKFKQVILTAVTAVSGNLTRSVSKNLSAPVAVAGSLVRQVNRVFITPVALPVVSAQIKAKFLTLTANVAVAAGNIKRKVTPNFTVSIIIVTGNIRGIARTIQGTFAVAGQTVRGITRVFTAPIAVVIVLTQSKFKSVILAVSIAMSTTVRRSVFKLFAAPVAVATQTVRGVFKKIVTQAAVTPVVVYGRKLFITFAVKVAVISSVAANSSQNLQDLVFKQGVALFQWVTGAASSAAKRWKIGG